MIVKHPLLPIGLIACCALIGLFLGLTGEGVENVLADLALVLCVLPIIWAFLRR